MDSLTPDYRWERDLDNEITDLEKAEKNIKDEFERLRPLYMNWIEDYCNVTFNEASLPGPVSLALEELVKTDPKSYNVTTEKLSDMSITYGSGTSSAGGASGAMPAYILAWLEPYRRAHLLDKKKRPYYDGR